MKQTTRSAISVIRPLQDPAQLGLLRANAVQAVTVGFKIHRYLKFSVKQLFADTIRENCLVTPFSPFRTRLRGRRLPLWGYRLPDVPDKLAYTATNNYRASTWRWRWRHVNMAVTMTSWRWRWRWWVERRRRTWCESCDRTAHESPAGKSWQRGQELLDHNRTD